MEPESVALYSSFGRPSIPPDMMLRALLLMALYSIRSERSLMEHLRYKLLFRWFVGLNATDAVWDASTFSKDRDRLLSGEIARLFFNGVRSHAQARNLTSSDQFTVDGSLIEAWASHKSVKKVEEKKEKRDPPSKDGGSNIWVNFHNERKTNESHRSTTDPDARLLCKKEAKLCFQGHVLVENRYGLIMDLQTTMASGTAEVEASLELLTGNGGKGATVRADKLYNQTKFVEACREHGIIPHVAQNDTSRKSCVFR